MRYTHFANLAAKFLIAAISVFIILPADSVSAQQVKDSKIEVMVCPGDGQSDITVLEPVSDTIVSKNKVKFSGTVKSISQIDFYVDDNYNSTVALGYSDTTFESVLRISIGTHTIKLVAYDSCHNTTHTRSVVLTYQPNGQPSNGSDVPTHTPESGGGSTTSGGDMGSHIPDNTVSPVDPDNSLLPVPKINPIEEIARDLDIDTTAKAGIADVLRASSVIVGISLIAAAPALLFAWARRRKGNQDQATQVPGPKMLHKHHHHMLMRLFGLVLLIVPFLV